MSEQNEKKTTEGKPRTTKPKTTVADAAKRGVVGTKVKKNEKIAKPETAEETVAAIVSVLQEKKGQHIVSVKVDHLTVVADYFVIASATSTTGVRALAENVDEKMSKLGVPPVRTDGLREGKWAALDFGNVIVHVFHSATREIYQLEKLWTDGTNVTEY